MISATLFPGEIVLLEHIPQDNPYARKIRPALLLSNSEFNRSSLDVIVVPLTSQIRHEYPYQIIIDTASPHFKETGLKCSSAIKCGYIFAYPKNRIKSKLGHVSQAVLKNIIRVITGILA